MRDRIYRFALSFGLARVAGWLTAPRSHKYWRWVGIAAYTALALVAGAVFAFLAYLHGGIQ